MSKFEAKQEFEEEFDVYEAQKQKIMQEINRDNADEMFIQSMDEFSSQIKNLNINVLADIETFYLTALKLRQSSYFILINKEIQRGMTFTEARDNVAPGEVLDFLIDHFNVNLNAHHLVKINDIERTYRPGMQDWARSHCDFLAVMKNLDKYSLALTEFIENKISYLTNKANELENNGKPIPNAASILSNNLQTITQNYLIDKDNKKFKEEINSAITIARPALEMQSGLKQFLDDIANRLIAFFTKAPPLRFSLFVNPVKENLDKLAQFDYQPLLGA